MSEEKYCRSKKTKNEGNFVKEKIAYILKHNLIIQKAYRIVLSALLRFIGVFIKTDSNLVLFTSFSGKSFNDSPKAIYDYMVSNDRYNKYCLIWAFNDPESFNSVESVKMDSIKYFYTALKAKYWITNTNIERGLKFKKQSQIYLNTWHGVPLKLIGNDCPGRKDFDFSCVDFLTVSGEYEEKIYERAFNIAPQKFLKCGMPRNDELWKADELKRKKVFSELGIPENKKVILYAPTWRDSKNGGNSYSLNLNIDAQRWKRGLGENFVLLFRAHSITNCINGLKVDDFIKDVSDYADVNALMIAADILISDYSAISFDFSILHKPIICYAYDFDEYLKERGTYINIKDLYGNCLCISEDEVIKKIINMDYNLESSKASEIQKRFMQYGGNAAEICVNHLFNTDGSEMD